MGYLRAINDYFSLGFLDARPISTRCRSISTRRWADIDRAWIHRTKALSIKWICYRPAQCIIHLNFLRPIASMFSRLTHRVLNKMATNLQTICSSTFSGKVAHFGPHFIEIIPRVPLTSSY